MGATPDTDVIDALIRQRVDEILSQQLEAKLAELKASRTSSMTIIATKGTLDWAYPPFILASNASALGWDVSVFFTFYGLQLLRKDLSGLKISPLGNPGMPMKMPFGPDGSRASTGISERRAGNHPGFESFATTLMKQTIHNNGVAESRTSRGVRRGGVNLIGCQMTVDLFGSRMRTSYRR